MIENVEVPKNLEHFRLLVLLEYFILLNDLFFIIKVGSLP